MQFAQGQTEKLTKAKIQLKATNSQSVVLIRQFSPVLGLKLSLSSQKPRMDRWRPGNVPRGQLWLTEHLATRMVLLLVSLISLKHFSQNKFS